MGHTSGDGQPGPTKSETCIVARPACECEGISSAGAARSDSPCTGRFRGLGWGGRVPFIRGHPCPVVYSRRSRSRSASRCSRPRAGPVRRTARPAEGHHPEGTLRVRPRRRLLSRQLRAVRRVPRQTRKGIRPHQARQDRRDRGEAPAAHGHRDFARQPQETAQLSGDHAASSPTQKASQRRTRRSSPTIGKAVVWIDGGLHASEVLCARRSPKPSTSSRSATDAETLRILDDVIILFVHANPDGMDLVRRLVHARQGPEEAVARRAAACSTRSTSGTTTTATSTPTPRPRRGT